MEVNIIRTKYVLLGWVIIFMFPPLILNGQGSKTNPNQDDFSKITASLTQLKQQNARFIIPNTYKNVNRAYDDYIRSIRDGKTINEMQEAYSKFESIMARAKERVNRANEVLRLPLSKRTDAEEVNAHTIVPDTFSVAEKQLYRAIALLEDDKVSDAFNLGQDAALLYRRAKILVIEMSLIGPAKVQLAEARRKNLHKLAPVSFKTAYKLLGEITEAIENDRPISPELQKQANIAQYKVQRAVKIAAYIDTLQKNQDNWEKLILLQEKLASQPANFVGISPDFLVDKPQDIVIESTQRWAARQDSLIRLIETGRKETSVLNGKIDSLNSSIKQQQIRLSAMVENFQRDLQKRKENLDREKREVQAYLREKELLDAAAEARSRFKKTEAIVKRSENKLSLKLVGISFNAGKSSISKTAKQLLKKVEEFILLYPKALISIEGHTDSTGDNNKNISLSKSRAMAVMNFLSQNTKLLRKQMTATGLGSSRPISTNKTRKGRDQNRRIDLIITFSK